MCAAAAREATSREIYRDNLWQLKGGEEVTSVEEIQCFCPHLKAEQIQGLMTEAVQKYVYFAVPTVLIKNSYHVLSLTEKTDDSCVGQAKKVFKLFYAYFCRTKESFAKGSSYGCVFLSTQFSKEAIEYAETHWPNSLIGDSWQTYGKTIVQDPLDHVGGFSPGYPKTKAVIHWTTKRNWGELINDHSKKLSTLWNESLIYFTYNALEGRELQGGRSTHVNYYCSHCGEAFEVAACKVCEAVFRDDQVRTYEKGSLPEKFIPSLKEMGLLDKRPQERQV